MALHPYMEWIPIKKKQIHVRNSKQALNHGLVLKKVHRVITFNQVTLLKLYTDMNTDIKKKKQKMILKNMIFEVDEQSSFWKQFWKNSGETVMIFKRKQKKITQIDLKLLIINKNINN